MGSLVMATEEMAGAVVSVWAKDIGEEFTTNRAAMAARMPASTIGRAAALIAIMTLGIRCLQEFTVYSQGY